MPSNNLYITFIVMSIKFYLCLKKKKKERELIYYTSIDGYFFQISYNLK